MKLVLKIGGSILYQDGEINVSLIQHWLKIIKKLNEEGHTIGIVVGGGVPARKFRDVAKELGATASYQDYIGINAARQNARLFISGLPNAYPHPPRDYQELIKTVANHSLIVVGGFQPGQSTNAVAAIFAEYLEADYLFNLSIVKHVYERDPEEDPNAKSFTELDYSSFAKIVLQNEQSPGKYALFDAVGLSIVQRSKLRLIFLDGRSPELIFDVLNGKPHGTLVYEA